MLPFDSYLDVLSEHARGHHVVGSAWIVLLVLGIIVLAMFACS